MNSLTVAKLRKTSASLVHELLPQFVGKSEIELSQALCVALSSLDGVLPTGWYEPPPHGICVLSAQAPAFERLNFDSLRRQEYWPTTNRINTNSVVTIYVSPVLKDSLLIGDWGGTISLGDDPAICNHIRRCENMMKELAHTIQPGTLFSEIHRIALLRFKKERLNNAATVSDSDPNRTNLGHTVPFSFAYELPPHFDSESKDYRVRISTARRFLNATETLCVPANGIFTFEARLIDEIDSSLPNTLVHLMISMKDGLIEVL